MYCNDMMSLKIKKIIKLTVKNGDDITKMKESIIIYPSNDNKITDENSCVISDSNNKIFTTGRYFLIIFMSMLFTIYIFIIYYLLNFSNL